MNEPEKPRYRILWKSGKTWQLKILESDAEKIQFLMANPGAKLLQFCAIGQDSSKFITDSKEEAIAKAKEINGIVRPINLNIPDLPSELIYKV